MESHAPFNSYFYQVEIKNMNSYNEISRAIDYEVSRQILLHKESQADEIVQETRLWDEFSQVSSPLYFLILFSPISFFLSSLDSFHYLHPQKTFTMRKKEGLADYRYFPEPDLPEVVLTSEYVEEIRNSMPELPEAKRRRYVNMGLSMQDVIFLANDDKVIIFGIAFISLHGCGCYRSIF